MLDKGLVDAMRQNNDAVSRLMEDGNSISCREGLTHAFGTIQKCLELYDRAFQQRRHTGASIADHRNHHNQLTRNSKGKRSFSVVKEPPVVLVVPAMAVAAAAAAAAAPSTAAGPSERAVRQEGQDKENLQTHHPTTRSPMHVPLLIPSRQSPLPACGDLYTFRTPLQFAPSFIDELLPRGVLLYPDPGHSGPEGRAEEQQHSGCPPSAASHMTYIVSSVVIFNIAMVLHHQNDTAVSHPNTTSLKKAQKLYRAVIQLVSESPKPELLRPLFIDLSILAWNNFLQVSFELGDYQQATQALYFLQRFCRIWRLNHHPPVYLLDGAVAQPVAEGSQTSIRQRHLRNRRGRLLEQGTFMDIATASILVQQYLASIRIGPTGSDNRSGTMQLASCAPAA